MGSLTEYDGSSEAPARHVDLAVGPTRLDDILRGGQVRTVFQPIVELDTGAVVAYEALSRGPAGELERPDVLFATARAEHRLAELDSLCRSAALRNAVRVGLVAPLTVFVNIEPEVLDSEPLDELIEIARSASGELQVVLEITERAISARPAELLSCVRTLRAAGWRVALDDVGADDMSLAFMPLLRPDVVKLDLKLVQERPGPAVAGIMNAVNAYAQRTGAIILAEGIEDEHHLEIARALGATLGQGWMFGRPAPQLNTVLPTAELLLPAAEVAPTPPSPFGCLPEKTPLRRSSKPLLVELSKHLEQEAIRHGSTCVVISTFQVARHFTPKTAERYRRLADHVGFVAAIGEGLSSEPVAGVRGADLIGESSLHNEWDIVVLAPHFSAALLARDLGDTGPDSERHFDFALTYDRTIVSSAAEALLTHVLPVREAKPGFAATSRAAAPLLAPTAPAAPGLDHLPKSVDVLRRALAATSNGISIADVTRPNHPLIYVNAGFERLSGLTAHEVIGTNCRLLQGPGTDPAAVARISDALARGVECRETLLNYRHGDDEPWWNEVFLAPVFDDAGRLVQYIGVQNDVTARVTAEAELAQEKARSLAYLDEIESIAFLDPLTGLLNRRNLDERLTGEIDAAHATSAGLGFLYIDVDGFKRVNDTHGHTFGDAVLTEVAVRLRDRRRPRNLVARLGGDEFLVVIPGPDRHDVASQTQRFADEIRRRMQCDIAGHAVRVSIGTSTYPEDGHDFDSLVRAADQRMYEDKPALPARGPGDQPCPHPTTAT